VTVEPAATTTSVTASANPSALGQVVTFTAAVHNADTFFTGVPTGSVTFVDQTTNTTLGTVTLDGTGHASFTPPAPLSAGTHTITAAYVPDANFSAGSSTLSEVVNQVRNVTAKLRITRSGQPLRQGNLFRQTLVVKNVSDQVIQGPHYLVLDGLPRGVKLLRAAGATTMHLRPGDPYVILPAGQLKPGQAVKVTLVWSNPRKVPVHFTTSLLAGLGLV
jgi:hypothetical protein